MSSSCEDLRDFLLHPYRGMAHAAVEVPLILAEAPNLLRSSILLIVYLTQNWCLREY